MKRGKHSKGWCRVARELDRTLQFETPTGRRRAKDWPPLESYERLRKQS